MRGHSGRPGLGDRWVIHLISPHPLREMAPDKKPSQKVRKGWNGIESQVCLTCIVSLRVAPSPHSNIEWIALTTSNSCYLKYKRRQFWKRPWCWEGLGAGGEGDDRGWDGWMASLTRWTWVWVNSRSWWWTGRPRVLQLMGSQRVGHDWATELNWTELKAILPLNL